MTLLAFDCSLRRFSAVLLDPDGTTRTAVAREPGTWRGEEIVTLLDRLCRSAGYGWRQLEALAVTVGPGSFTGIRTAVAIARALALAADLPVYPVGTLEALALAGGDEAEDRLLAALLPGKRGHFYLQTFGTGLSPLAPPVSVPAEELAVRIPETAVVVTSDPGRLAASPSPWREVRRALPEAAAVAALARRRIVAGDGGIEGRHLEPLYLRAADADPTAGRPLVVVAD